MLRFAQALIAQMAQTALCNTAHTAEQQLCRWLLLSLDGLPSSEQTIPRELLAEMPGLRSDEVTQAVMGLWAAGSIQYRRGKILVLDRPKLARRSCECYGLVKRESERLLPRRHDTLEALA
jgi:CRP-like cAMP-binding protein